MRLRIALHTGAVIPEGTERFGKTGMLAVRIAAKAGGGEILVSAALQKLAGSAGYLPFGPRRTIEIEESADSFTAYEVCWGGKARRPRPRATCFAGRATTGRSHGADGAAG